MPSGPSGRVWSMGPVSAAHQSERRLEVNGKRFVCDGIGGRNGAKECSWNGEDLATGQFVDEVNGKVFADDGGGHRSFDAGSGQATGQGEVVDRMWALGGVHQESMGKRFVATGGRRQRSPNFYLNAFMDFIVVGQHRNACCLPRKAYFESGPTSSGKAAYSTSTIHVNLIFLPAIDPDPADDKRKKSEEEVRRSGMMITQSKRPTMRGSDASSSTGEDEMRGLEDFAWAMTGNDLQLLPFLADLVGLGVANLAGLGGCIPEECPIPRFQAPMMWVRLDPRLDDALISPSTKFRHPVLIFLARSFHIWLHPGPPDISSHRRCTKIERGGPVGSKKMMKHSQPGVLDQMWEVGGGWWMRG
ncbi:hypothetical protein BDK51DRAFT_42869 [Blyttiomyces helicus]|uniref:Uncharacterized protein n=1 Tax=Blyttiomyces helicus TaxID=388810 RepID=A0A4V1ISF4_9FUNG|nr:hypothetical protein BDK51DRAFT_42869 [Blyttiomyces helicus]|eukprot:RKO93367.1 hypothetical protein BDK51DRAFT_42869 [Blyttiomyces helicus]